MTVSAIIVDDEPNLVEYLERKLASLWPELRIVGIAHSGPQSIEIAHKVKPDIAFLDIRLPGISGLEVAKALPIKTQIVFVTAYDEFAVEAFKHAAVDYLVKPVDNARLAETITRLKNRESQNRGVLIELLRNAGLEQSGYLEWIRAGFRDTTEIVSVRDVIYCKAEYKYTSVITRDRTLVIRSSIQELEQSLDPDQFWRIHRAIIVRVDQILKAKRDLRGRYILTLRDHQDSLRSSRSYAHLFKHM